MSANGRKKDYLFVYGTLRKGLGHPMRRVLARHAKFVGMGKFRGKLYDLGKYPGAAASGAESDAVRGELYRFGDAERIFPILDGYEGPRFRREIVTVSVGPKKKLRLWIYLYAGALGGLKPILSGDYLEFRQGGRGAVAGFKESP